MPEKLMPCPFCGSQDIVSSIMCRKIEPDDKTLYLEVDCKECGGRMSIIVELENLSFESFEKAIEEAKLRWNRRLSDVKRNNNRSSDH
jgi:Lar family restriction alleviation protein